MSYITKYYVNKEKRTVVCVIESREYDALDYIEKGLGDINFYDTPMTKKNEKNYLMPTRFVGVAKCSPQDEFNEETGRTLAFHRAKLKYDASFMRVVDYCIQQQCVVLDHMKNRFSHFLNKATEHYYKRLSKLENVMAGEE